MDELSILESVYGIIEKSWCKDAIARHDQNRIVDPLGTMEYKYDKDGKLVSEKLWEATSWSVTGAIMFAENSKTCFKTEAYKYVQAACKARGYNYIVDFENPDKSKGKTSLQNVLDMLQDALDNCRNTKGVK